MAIMVRFYARQRSLKWRWQSIDSKSCPAPLGGEQTGKTRRIVAKGGVKFICWWISVAHRWLSTSARPIAMTSVRLKTCCCRWSYRDLILSTLSNMSVLIVATTMRMCINWLNSNVTLPTSNTGDDAGNQLLRTAQSLAKPVIRPGAGWLNAPSVDLINAAVCGFAGAKRLKTGWHWFNSLALISCLI